MIVLNSIKKISTKIISQGKIINILSSILRYVVLLSVGYIVIYPLIYALSMSFRSYNDFLDPNTIWLPSKFITDNYKNAIELLDFGKSFFNTVRLEIVSALLEVLSCSVVAYGMARYNFFIKKIVAIGIALTLIIPYQMIIMPLVINFSNLDFLGIISLINNITGSNVQINLLDTGWTFYLPSILGVGLRSGMIIFIYIQFFKGLPKELEEAAWIDGANPFMTFLKIVIPSSGVAILTVLVFSLIWHWNDYYLAVMYTSNNLPLAVSLSNLSASIRSTISLNKNVAIAIIMAGCVLFILPMLVVYMILQRNFVKSIDRVGITG